MLRIRIIPATITTAFLLLGVKIIDIARGTESLSIAQVEAQQPSPETAKPAADAKKSADAKSDAKAEAKPADASKGNKKEADKTDKKEGDSKEGDKKEGEKKEGEKKEGDKDKNPNVSSEPGDTVDRHFSAVELELLQNLARRRDELDRWEKNIQIKEATLDATEKRIDEKVEQIDAMKKEVANLLAQYNEKEDAKIHSLVKIYENMKPKDAARIFDEVEMPILLLVIDKMSEKKAAPILAEMNPRKAKDITVQLAEQRRVNSVKLNAAAPVAATTPPTTPATTPASAPAPAAATPKTAQP